MGITWGSSPLPPTFVCKVFEAGNLGLYLSGFWHVLKIEARQMPG
jgi:hypothetical protein